MSINEIAMLTGKIQFVLPLQGEDDLNFEGYSLPVFKFSILSEVNTVYRLLKDILQK